jgi:hypothetical protein
MEHHDRQLSGAQLDLPYMWIFQCPLAVESAANHYTHQFKFVFLGGGYRVAKTTTSPIAGCPEPKRNELTCRVNDQDSAHSRTAYCTCLGHLCEACPSAKAQGCKHHNRPNYRLPRTKSTGLQTHLRGMTSTLHTVRLRTASALGTSVKYATSAKQSPGPSSVLPVASGGVTCACATAHVAGDGGGG